MRGLLRVLILCMFSTGLRAEQIFIPVDSAGDPIEASTRLSDDAESSVESSTERDAEQESARQVREADYRAQVESLTQAYVGCLAEESGRLFGADYEHCAAERSQLHALYPAEYAGRVLDCLEIAVLGKALFGAAECGLIAQSPVEAVSASRWR